MAPYDDQTAMNTSKDWLGGHQTVDVNIHGMVDFARNMMVVRENLDGSTGYLQPLSSLPSDAWQNGALPEGRHVGLKMGYHYAELRQFLMFMSEGLQNIGRAAQTIADAYQGTDGWSAASLDAVEFAFGDTSGGQPPGLPPGFPVQTWQQAFDESRTDGGAAQYGQADRWTEQSSFSGGSSTTTTYVNQDGLTRTVTVYSNGFGTETRTTITDANGKVLSSFSQQSQTRHVGPWSVVTTRTYDGNGNLTGTTQENTTTRGDGTVVQEGRTGHAPDGTQTSGTDTRIDPDDGSQVITTTVDDQEHEVHVGPATPGDTSGVIDSPATDAMKALGLGG